MFKYLIVLICLGSLSGCNVVNHIKLRYANDDLQANWPEQHQQVDLTTHYYGEKPYVEVTINGVPGFIFLIDTGASITYLMDTPKVNALSLEQGFSFDVGGWGDEENTQAHQTHLETLALSGASFSDVSAAFMPTSKSLYFLRQDEATFDGVLGHDILRHFNWKFDKANNKIAIRQTQYPQIESAVAVDFDVFLSKLEIDVEVVVDAKTRFKHEVKIDTGSRHYFKLNQTYLDENDIKLASPSVTAADFGLSGRALHQRTKLPAILLGDLEYKDIRTNLIKTDDSDEFWVIGSALLNQTVSIIDYQQNKLYLMPEDDFQFRSRFNLLGLEVRKIQSGEFVVRYIMPDMASANHDFQVGDLITRVNGIETANIDKNTWLELSNTPDTYQVCRMRQSERCFDVQTKHIVGYSN